MKYIIDITVTILKEGSSKIGMAILLIALLLVAKSCTDMESEQHEKEVLSAETVRMVDLVGYSDRANDPIDTMEEIAWIENECPEIVFGLYPRASKSRGIESNDDSFKYSGEYSLYHDGGGHGGGLFECRLSGNYTMLEGTVYLSGSSVSKWKSWQERKEELESQGKQIPYDCDDYGMCLIFADNELVYKSPILHPNGTLSDKISVNVTDADEIVICIAGIAYLGAPRVSK